MFQLIVILSLFASSFGHGQHMKEYDDGIVISLSDPFIGKLIN